MATSTIETPQKGTFAPVSGGSLYYETIGRGPTLVMMPAGHGTGVVFEPLAAILARHFRVILYDRRYFFRSCKCDPTDRAKNQSILKTHAEDAVALISHVSPGIPVYLFTTSSGAPIAAELLYSRPELIQSLIMHEASFFSLLPLPVHEQYRKDLVDVWSKGHQLGEVSFNLLIVYWVHRSEELKRLKNTPTYRRLASLPREAQFKWLANELPEVLEYEFEMDRMRPFRDRLILMRGSYNSPDAAVGPVTRLSDALGVTLGVVPGGHEGYVTDYREFAEFLIRESREDRARL
ncbi:alpha/beta-hydrolase [Aspergillus steynii IBT 23096]|uniref:Alpha/beta-hydrolase n=1 Tax=Aspergillus steynii IBT 23096 TaxID=1392250 RepID=A0A2I2GMM6_9EURO|nr:alpha/beta-hydrolase [Aspergillus steynii IBT 23096]PLB54123.1 alpha/beta-hydrolase [Aspergillus steynii IBT 23096]